MSFTPRKYSFEVPPAPIPASEIKEVIKTDIVVAGAGPSGLAAAASAAESGAKVVLLEKLHRIAAPGGPGAPLIGSKLQKERELRGEVTVISVPQNAGKPGMSVVPGAGDLPPMVLSDTPNTKEEIIRGLYKATEGRADIQLIKLWADKSAEVGDWLIDAAKENGYFVHNFMYSLMFSKTPDLRLSINRTPCRVDEVGDDDRGGELALLHLLRDEALRRGVDIRYSTPAVRLIRPDNKSRVTGIIARKSDGSYIQLNISKAVILCTGDYGLDEEMVDKYCPWLKGIPRLTLNTVTGDGHKMGLWIGAAIEDGPHCAVIHFNSTNEEPVSHFRPVGAMAMRGNYLYVNQRGERFLNEDDSDEILANSVLRQSGKTYWQVFDSKSVDDKCREDVKICMQTGAVLMANTIEELAFKFGANSRVFKATVDRYNELVRLGQDLDYDKKPEKLIAVDTPPFYVCESPPDLLCTLGGFSRNAEGQILDTDMNIIPGLYAAGNIVGGFWGDTYPMHFLGGIARSHALVFGRLAGLHAAKAYLNLSQ